MLKAVKVLLVVSLLAVVLVVPVAAAGAGGQGVGVGPTMNGTGGRTGTGVGSGCGPFGAYMYGYAWYGEYQPAGTASYYYWGEIPNMCQLGLQ